LSKRGGLKGKCIFKLTRVLTYLGKKKGYPGKIGSVFYDPLCKKKKPEKRSVSGTYLPFAAGRKKRNYRSLTEGRKRNSPSRKG